MGKTALATLLCILSFTSAADSALYDEPTPYLGDKDLPPRTPPIIELGGDFLGTGNINPGFSIPTGAIWQPKLWVYGNMRSGIQAYDLGDNRDTVSEFANRLDLFANLQLTGTERVVLGISPLHRDNRFSGIVDDGTSSESVNEFNSDIETLFFEGDIAELFPNWDKDDSSKNDIGFSVGRQQILFQEGFLINDTLDGIGLSKNNLIFSDNAWLTNLRSTLFYAWNQIHRNGIEDEDASLVALFNQIDTIKRTINIDLAYVQSDGIDGNIFGYALDSIQRIGRYNTTFRIAGSIAEKDTPRANDGTLLFTEVSWTPHHTHNIAYVNGYVGINDYTRLASDPIAGGPLGRTGLLFAAQGLGSFPSALSGNPSDSYGISVGYQMFMGKAYLARRQLIIEVGARGSNSGSSNSNRVPGDEFGLALRFQQALGNRFVWQVDGFVADTAFSGTRTGLRTELLIKF